MAQLTAQKIEFHYITNYSFKDKPIKSFNITDAITILEHPNNYESIHLRLYDNIPYSLYADIDGTDASIDEIIGQLCNSTRENLKINSNDISITKSETTEKNSYHLVVKNISGNIQQQKFFWELFNKESQKYQVDISVYSNNRYFRLPNQLKPESGNFDKKLKPNTKHIVERGNLEDFLMIPDENSLELPSIPEQPEIKNQQSSIINNTSLDELDKLLDCLSVERCDSYKEWFEVACALKQTNRGNDTFQKFNEWSKKSFKYDAIATLNQWNSIKIRETRALTVKSLHMWAKQDNLEKYNVLFPVKCLINEEKEEQEYPFTEWEKSHCKILNPPIYLQYNHSREIHEESYIIRSTKTLKEAFQHLSLIETVIKKGQTIENSVSFIDKWISKNPKIRKYNNISVIPPPLKCPDETFNLWTNFKGELLDDVNIADYNKEISAFKRLLSVLTNHEQAGTDYLEKWIAQAIQFPAIKCSVPTIISKQGAGKGTLIRILEGLFGKQKVLSTTDASIVFGKFNPLMADAFIVNLDELGPKDVKDVEHSIKALITEPKMKIERKGMDAFEITSYHRFICTTNNEFGIFKTSDDDRRNAIFRASDELIGNSEFFNYINNHVINNNGAIKAIYKYLQQIPDLEQFYLSKNIPITNYSQELKEASRSPYDLWLESFTNKNRNSNMNRFTVKDLFEDFKKEFPNVNINDKSFGIRIINVVPNAIENIKSNGIRLKEFNWDILRSKYQISCLINNEQDFDDELNELN